MPLPSADAELLRELKLADQEYELRSIRAREEIREMLAFFYEHAGEMWYPGGDFFDFVREEADLLRSRVKPPRAPRTKRAKRRISHGQRTRIFERDRYRCVTCGTWEDLTIDHKIPESRGGTDDDENLQTMCRPCNCSKGTT